MAFAPALQALHVAERKTGSGEITAHCLHGCEHRKRVRYPMVSALRQREVQFHARQDGDNHSPAIQLNDVAGIYVSPFLAPEANHLCPMPPCGVPKARAIRRVKRNDRRSARFQPFEDFRLCVGDRLKRTQIFDMGRRDCRHQRQAQRGGARLGGGGLLQFPEQRSRQPELRGAGNLQPCPARIKVKMV